MIDSHIDPESAQKIPAHRNPMTLEEFLENDLEGYEYVKGELVPIPLASMEHKEKQCLFLD